MPALPQSLRQAALCGQPAAGQDLSMAAHKAEEDPPLFRLGTGLLSQADRRCLIGSSG